MSLVDGPGRRGARASAALIAAGAGRRSRWSRARQPRRRLQIVEGLWKLGGTGLDSGIPLITGAIARALVGPGVTVLGGAPPVRFDFWRSTRFIGPEDHRPDPRVPVLHVPVRRPARAHDLDAFPAAWRWCWRSICCAAGLAAGAFRLPVSGVIKRVLRALGTPAAATLLLASLTISVLRMINTWDYPTYLGLLVVAIFVSEAVRRERDWTVVGWRTVVLAARPVVVGQTLIAPYLRHYELFYTASSAPWPYHPAALLHHPGRLPGSAAAYIGFQFSGAAWSPRERRAWVRSGRPVPFRPPTRRPRRHHERLRLR